MSELDGLIAVITGAARGIGREHARRFAREGASVVLADRDHLDPLVEEIRAAGGRAVGVCCDVADAESSRAVIARAIEDFGRLDALVNNAGGGGTALVNEVEDAAWDAEIRSNLKTMFSATQAALDHWQGERQAGRSGRGSIVNTTSGAGLLGNPGQSPYGAAKAGIAAFSVIAAAELAGTGVRINAVAPAARTDAALASSDVVAQFMRAPDAPDDFDAWHPRNVAPLAVYLCSPRCELTGEVFHVRGGVIGHFEGWKIRETFERDQEFDLDELHEAVPKMVERAPDRREAGGAAYASLRAAWGDSQKGESN
jgi:NAD(P)-dependent dehydrogenase (short-subunit alcohol dehydrogenase family)